MKLPLARSRRYRIVRRLCVIAAGSIAILAALFVSSLWYRVYVDRGGLPDAAGFVRFEFPTIGRVYDIDGRPLIALARERRDITRYADIPPIVRDAILAAEDKRFFSHNGVDYLAVPRVVAKVRLGTVVGRLLGGDGYDESGGPAIFPQGGSTITQQLVRGYFLRDAKTRENSYRLRHDGIVARTGAAVIGARSVNMLARKREETRLSLWIEREMREQFGSKRRAKEEILARYATAVYMGHGQYGFARAAQYYFGRPLASFTTADAAAAALLAGIVKSPRDYAPDAKDPARVLRRRNQILRLMAKQAVLSREDTAAAVRRPLAAVVPPPAALFQSSAVVAHVLDELAMADPVLGIHDLLAGDIDVHSTVDARVQAIVGDALEHGLARYEQRHPLARGVIQGSVVVLRNRDGSILAEAGGRQIFRGRAASYSDLNRVTDSLRQPGSAMKPFAYLAAFRHGHFTLDSVVPDLPVSVPDGLTRKWIANYDGRFKGDIPIRAALAESRNAVAIWLTQRIGVDAVLRTSRSLGIRTPLRRYTVTALGASEVTLLELASAYRTMASGEFTEPYIVRRIVRRSGEVVGASRRVANAPIDAGTLALIQEGLRGAVRLPSGTAHSLAAADFPIAVMGKTGTTNDFRDALFVGATFGPAGITVAVRIGFDDNRSLGSGETGGRVALPVFREVMAKVYGDGADILGPAPSFPVGMERRITAYLRQIGARPAATALALPSS